MFYLCCSGLVRRYIFCCGSNPRMSAISWVGVYLFSFEELTSTCLLNTIWIYWTSILSSLYIVLFFCWRSPGNSIRMSEKERKRERECVRESVREKPAQYSVPKKINTAGKSKRVSQFRFRGACCLWMKAMYIQMVIPESMISQCVSSTEFLDHSSLWLRGSVFPIPGPPWRLQLWHRLSTSW